MYPLKNIKIEGNKLRILITGSAGLVGRGIIPLLEKENHTIIHFDNRFDQSHLNFGDILDPQKILEKISNCHGVIHLAGISRVIWGEQDPIKCWQHNVYGTRNIIEAASKSYKKPWILFASSREVYGQQDAFPVDETAMLRPKNIYAQSKCEAENHINQAKNLGLTTAIMRLSSVYGDAMDHSTRVVPAFCKAALEDSVLKVEGNKNICDFTHVNDIAKCLLACIKILATKKSLPPMHLTSGIGTKLDDLAKLIISLCPGSQACIEYTDPRSYDVHQFVGNPNLANKILNVKLEVSLEDGIKSMINQYQSLLEKA